MYMYVYVYICMCVYICMYVYICVCIYMYIVGSQLSELVQTRAVRITEDAPHVAQVNTIT